MQQLETDDPEQIADYISNYLGHCEKWFGPAVNLKDKRVLILGSGWGTEALWALSKGASEVVGIDPELRDREPLDIALKNRGMEELMPRVSLLQHTSFDAPDLGQFDYVLSNNVVEHITGLSATLYSLRRFMPKDRRSRIVIFTDPLFFSSSGAHFYLRKWEHLTMGSARLKTRVSEVKWDNYRNTLNGMTITDMLGAVREAGLIILDLKIIADRHLSEFNKIAPFIPSGIKPMDLCLEGLFLKLSFPENL
ncbi:class I SAM-dependent methyltransferase [Neorhizobium sp. DT-125]|uniref:class I SAM-dependent methyltransferase n=1 Tax=Neorhizobium sp. DT-125 TaxID=3396163 RepID=UPI003F1B8BDC